MDATIHTDGAARGNPGPAAAAYVIERADTPPVEHAEKLGTATNNVAEYTALILALERASQLGLRRVAVFSDSELMVKQFHGEYSVKNAELRELYAQARALARYFDVLTLTHVRRGDNRRADWLCNTVLDGRRSAGQAGKLSAKPGRGDVRSKRNSQVDERAVACLRSALEAARDCAPTTGPTVPTAEQVWEQLWSVLEEAGMSQGRRKRSS